MGFTLKELFGKKDAAAPVFSSLKDNIDLDPKAVVPIDEKGSEDHSNEDDDDGSVYSTLIRMTEEEFAEILLNSESGMAKRYIDQFRGAFDSAVSSLFDAAHSTVVYNLIDGFSCRYREENDRFSILKKCRWLDSPWDNKYIDVDTDDMNLVIFKKSFEKLDKPSVFEATRKMTKGELALFESYVQGQMIPVVTYKFKESVMAVSEMFSEVEKTALNIILLSAEKWANRYIKKSVKELLEWYDDPW